MDDDQDEFDLDKELEELEVAQGQLAVQEFAALAGDCGFVTMVCTCFGSRQAGVLLTSFKTARAFLQVQVCLPAGLGPSSSTTGEPGRPTDHHKKTREPQRATGELA